MTTIIILIFALIILSIVTFTNDRNKYVSQNLDSYGGIVNKYQELIASLLKEPSSSIKYQDRDRVVIQKISALSKEEFIITETFGELVIQWESKLGLYKKEEKSWTFSTDKPQKEILKVIRTLMISRLDSDEAVTIPKKYIQPTVNDKFGFSDSYPINVQGVKGEISYLSSLRNENNEKILFHRLGSFDSKLNSTTIDIYEIVSSETEKWDILYFNMYNKSITTKTPKGYYLASDLKESIENKEVFGASTYINTFPLSLSLILNNEYKNHDLNLNKKVSQILQNKDFTRSKTHILRLLETECVGMFFNKLSKNCSIYPIHLFQELLASNNIKGQIFALKCLQYLEKGDGTLSLFKELSNVCHKTKDFSIMNETIKVIQAVEPEIHNYWEFLNTMNTSEYVEISIGLLTAPVDETTKYLSTPYLYLAASNKNTDPEFSKFCLNKLEENKHT